MIFKNSLPSKSRRGLASIVGALLFVVLMVSAFAVLSLALDSQSNIASTGSDVAAKDLKKLQEDFSLNNIEQAPGGYLKIELTNNGQNTAEIFTVVMTNKTDTGEPTSTIDIPSETSYLPVGAETPTNIVKTLNLKMDIPTVAGTTEDYDFKVISSLGTIKKMSIECSADTQICGKVVPPSPAGTPGLSATLYLDGPTGVNSKVSTVIMFVQNTGTVPLEDIHPVNEFCSVGTFPTVQDLGNPNNIPADFTSCNDITTSYDSTCGSALLPPSFNKNDGNGICLGPGQTAIFKWDGTVKGDINDELDFCNQVEGQDYDDNPVGPSNPSCDALVIIDPNDCGGCSSGNGGESIIILDDLLIRPSIFLTLPSPFGSTTTSGYSNMGIFGVQVANPTNSTFSVSKLTITAFAPGANNNILIFDKTGNTTNISPNCCAVKTGDWNLSDENVMVWRNFTSPIVFPPYSASSFLLKVKPQTNGDVLEAVIVQSSVFSSIGSFGKAGYQTTQYPAGGTVFSPIANVFLANNPDSDATTDITGTKTNITNGTTTQFIVTLADMDKAAASYIKTGAKLIINIPRQWTYDSIVSPTDPSPHSSSKFVFNATEPKVIHHGDGSTQIIATTNEDIGNQDSVEAASIVFNATPPNEKTDRMYIMYLLADGLTEANYSVGPQQEAILHVIGNSTSP